MPRLTKKLPSYRLHKASGHAVVTLGGRQVYLGPHGSPGSKAEYDRVIAEWLGGGRSARAVDVSSSRGDRPRQDDLSVNELMVLYWRHAERYYTREGEVARELDNIRDALRHLKPLYGHTSARAFGPKALKTIRQGLIDKGLARSTINARIQRIQRMFRWAAGEELIPADVHHGLKAVEGLRRGRDGAREAPAVKPVPDEHVAAVLPHVTAPIRAMIQLQDLTGMRPGEVMTMRGCEIEQGEGVWIYRPGRHKTLERGKDRSIPIGPRAQAILAEWLQANPQAYLFSPIVAVERRNAEKRRNRKTPMTPSQAARRPKASPKRAPRRRYDKRTYNTAIARACDKAGVPKWAPNQLRHAVATRIRKLFSLEAAQVVLGHAKADVTQIYAERDLSRASDIARQVG
ncbi:tyrosine-type recombinase/integrase [Singulisphaera sp. PoT]|uniref:tyrosine-type recombinase/integrase n=1 Tax=Singulisphaera sp. PoT TaxID=3411797 RepID=UPI003BF5CED6